MGSVSSCIEGVSFEAESSCCPGIGHANAASYKGENLSRHSGDIDDLGPILIVSLRDAANRLGRDAGQHEYDDESPTIGSVPTVLLQVTD